MEEKTKIKHLHKDFHIAMCYIIEYLDKNLGKEATKEYLWQLGKTFYSPLTERLKRQGVSALEEHWRDVFSKEDGKFRLQYEGGMLVLTVEECPAVKHLKEKRQFHPRFCRTTVVVNEAICDETGYACSCEYVLGAGKCVQRFWKREE